MTADAHSRFSQVQRQRTFESERKARFARDRAEALRSECHVLVAEVSTGGEIVVCATAQAQVVGGALAAERDRDDVIVFEERPRFAAVSVWTEIRAATAVAGVDFAGHLCRDR